MERAGRFTEVLDARFLETPFFRGAIEQDARREKKKNPSPLVP